MLHTSGFDCVPATETDARLAVAGATACAGGVDEGIYSRAGAASARTEHPGGGRA